MGWKEDALRHKYDPLPEEPRHRKRSKRRHVKSNHKHVYEQACCRVRLHSCDLYYVGTRCIVCGRIGSMAVRPQTEEPPDDMPLYEFTDMMEFWDAKELGEERRVR